MRSQLDTTHPFESANSNRVKFDLPLLDSGSHGTQDDSYDDADVDGFGDSQPTASTSRSAGSSDKSGERHIRRRSSKACDQCRKLKCKCERTGSNIPCRNCVTLNAECTFLGPSRKRGPPKGYIDAIEARLHQTEAVLGIILSLAGGLDGSRGNSDPGASSLIEDLCQDPLAHSILLRVEETPYGSKSRGKPSTAAPSKLKPHDYLATSAHPSNEWQDQVISKIQDLRSTGVNGKSSPIKTSPLLEPSVGGRQRSVPSVDTSFSSVPGSEDDSPRRVRRKIDSGSDTRQTVSPGSSNSPLSPHVIPNGVSNPNQGRAASLDSRTTTFSEEGECEIEGEGDLDEAVGQLSLNEDEQVRFHGKASGLHLLAPQERIDGRSEGGIWKFPKARVWPPLPPSDRAHFAKCDGESSMSMPPLDEQEKLLDLYWKYVHTALPIVHKESFLDNFQRGSAACNSPRSVESGSSASPIPGGRDQTPAVLLLSMFSIAARYTDQHGSEVSDAMWPAGDSYFESARATLASTYSTPRIGTCQALLLLGYREVGIGAMAQAWIYMRMAITMAQDLGIHKTAEKWRRTGVNMFTKAELQERRRIWYACIVMDKYISSYIGRPVAISARDFDTELPSDDAMEEHEVLEFQACPSASPGRTVTIQSHTISCFNAASTLSMILSSIVQCIYAIRPEPTRTSQFHILEEALDNWLLELPEHLRYDPAAAKFNGAPARLPPPNVLTLHMKYWCTVILLHRPFIKHLSSAKGNRETESKASHRSQDICVQAANKITAIVATYTEKFSICKAPVFLSYYVFTASITHVSILTSFPDDPQARLGLNKCMETLRTMDVIWPSAGRAWELLNGNKVNLLGHSSKTYSNNPTERQQHHKRPADTQLPDNSPRNGGGSQASGFSQVYANGASDMGSYPSLVDPSNHSPYYDYSRWLGSTDLLGNATTNNLSTSLLPQQYSTGFVGGVSRSSQGHRHRGSDPNARYPQPLWTDHSAMGQLDPTYVGMLPQQSPPGQHVASSQGLVSLVNQTHQDQPMYQLAENYYY